jgi:dTDP-4-amino-4,6-dideoxygalactose transaminase
MSNLTRNILGAIDYEKVIESRNNNFSYLHDRLKVTNVLDIKTPEGAFAYPYYIKNGIEVRKKLAEKKTYVPTLWPNVLRENDENSIEYDFAANILPLPCDQRYTEDDMKVIIQSIQRY